jgi:hypothetical protein
MIQNKPVASVAKQSAFPLMIALTQGPSLPDEPCILPEKVLDLIQRLLRWFALTPHPLQRSLWVFEEFSYFPR